MLTRRLSRPLAIGGAVVVIVGGAYGIANATSGTGSPGAGTGPTANPGFVAQAGANARSGPAAGGVIGKVGTVSTSSFTVSTATRQKVTVKTASSTTYRKGTSSASARAVTTGRSVLVLGTSDGRTITAKQVVVQPPSGGSPTYSPSKVIGFERGAPTTSKHDGQVPASYSEGSGTIVGAATANKAIKAALAAYSGGVVNRVVQLSNGEYQVHNVGVSWPHHIFVSKSFAVIGAS